MVLPAGFGRTGLAHGGQPNIVRDGVLHESPNIGCFTGLERRHVNRSLFDVTSQAPGDSLRHGEVKLNMATSRVTHNHTTTAVILAEKFFLRDDQRSCHTLIPDHRCLIHRPEVLLASSVAPSQLIDNPLAVRGIVDDILL